MADEPPKIVSKTEARQGVTPHVTRYVLTWGLGGAIIVLAIAYLVFFWR
jgi:hypothetical protein